MGARLLAAAVLPALIMVAFVGSALHARQRAADEASAVARDLPLLNQLVLLRRDLDRERVPAEGLAWSRELLGRATNIVPALGFGDSGLAKARAPTDADVRRLRGVLPGRDVAALRALRRGIDRGTVSGAAADHGYADLSASISATFEVRLRQLMARTQDLTGARDLNEALTALADANDVLGAGTAASSGLMNVFFATTAAWPAELARMDQHVALYDHAAARLRHDGGPIRRRWSAIEASADAIVWRRTIQQAQSPDARRRGMHLGFREIASLAASMRPIQAHSNQLYGLVDAATRQALTNANDLRSSSGRSFRLLLLLIVLLGGATALAALRLARSIRRPLRQLAAQARAITAGDLGVDELPPHGPREVAVVTETFNEMVAALRRLEVEAAESRRQLLHEATHDHLTGLANRAAALEALGQALERARDRPGPLAVLFVDLDGFKAINDTHGHAAGDVVLSVIAQRLRDAAREGDVIARLGGDEFLLIVEGLADRAIAERIADRITTIAAHPVEMDGLLLHVGASVGVAFSQGADDTVSRLVARADAAVYRAKEQGRGTTFVLDDAA